MVAEPLRLHAGPGPDILPRRQARGARPPRLPEEPDTRLLRVGDGHRVLRRHVQVLPHLPGEDGEGVREDEEDLRSAVHRREQANTPGRRRPPDPHRRLPEPAEMKPSQLAKAFDQTVATVQTRLDEFLRSGDSPTTSALR